MVWTQRFTVGLLVTLSLLAGGGDLPGQEPSSTLSGTVAAYQTSAPLQGAAVSLVTGPDGTPGIGTRVTDSNGAFRFDQVPPGTYRLRVALLGYRESIDTLQVDPGLDLELSHRLSVDPVRLEPIVVVSERRALGPLAGFERRRQTHAGTFFDREDIDARNPYRLTDLLRMVPGARVIPVGPTNSSVRLRGGCRPDLWLDGVPVMAIDDMDDILPTMDVEAVEVYHGVTLPVQFGANPCGAIVVWTRRGGATGGSGSFWKKFGVGVVFAVLAIIATR